MASFLNPGIKATVTSIPRTTSAIPVPQAASSEKKHCRITDYIFLCGKKNNNIKRKVYGNRIYRKKDL